MPGNQKEIKISMEVSVKEASLLKKIRQTEGSGEFLLVIEKGQVKRLKYTKIFAQPASHVFTGEELMKFIQSKVPFGEVNLLTRSGKVYGMVSILEYDNLSDGL